MKRLAEFAVEMKQTFTIEGMTCGGCAATVKKAIAAIPGVESVEVDYQSGRAEVEASRSVAGADVISALAPWPAYKLEGAPSAGFWSDVSVWKRASFNTLNCLVGCSIGDFGMILYLQAFHPRAGMVTQMVFATIAGLCTSVALETVLLRVREKFPWGAALRTAFSMSFLSMVAMEFAMNTTDFMITGGKAAFDQSSYWLALGAALAAGFAVPLPYNYYKLKKFNKACH